MSGHGSLINPPDRFSLVRPGSRLPVEVFLQRDYPDLAVGEASALRSAEEVLAVVKAVAPKPVNVLMSGGLKLTVEQLSEMGVKRISVGSALALTALGEFYRAAQEIKTSGTFSFTSRSMPYAQANQLFKG